MFERGLVCIDMARLVSFDEPSSGFSIRDKCLFVEKTYDLLGMAGLVNFDEPDLSSYGKMIHGSSKLRSLFDEL